MSTTLLAEEEPHLHMDPSTGAGINWIRPYLAGGLRSATGVGAILKRPGKALVWTF